MASEEGKKYFPKSSGESVIYIHSSHVFRNFRCVGSIADGKSLRQMNLPRHGTRKLNSFFSVSPIPPPTLLLHRHSTLRHGSVSITWQGRCNPVLFLTQCRRASTAPKEKLCCSLPTTLRCQLHTKEVELRM